VEVFKIEQMLFLLGVIVTTWMTNLTFELGKNYLGDELEVSLLFGCPLDNCSRLDRWN